MSTPYGKSLRSDDIEASPLTYTAEIVMDYLSNEWRWSDMGNAGAESYGQQFADIAEIDLLDNEPIGAIVKLTYRQPVHNEDGTLDLDSGEAPRMSGLTVADLPVLRKIIAELEASQE